MLGHASAAMTLDVYAGLFPDDLDAVADRLDAVANREGGVAGQWRVMTVNRPRRICRRLGGGNSGLCSAVPLRRDVAPTAGPEANRHCFAVEAVVSGVGALVRR
jgi:hypothetical protein